MTDDPVLPELDARAASAATALRAEVAAFDLDLRPPHRSGHRGWLAAAAVLLAVALVAGAAWLAGGDDGDDVKTIDRPAPLYLFPDHVPDGLRFTGGAELDASTDQALDFPPADLYADGSREDVLFTWTADFGDGELTTPDGQGRPISINGRPGVASDEGDFHGISFRPGKRRVVTIAARGVPEHDLVALAEVTTVRGDRVVFPDGALPDQVERLGSIGLDRLALATFASPMAGGGGRSLAWASNDSTRVVAVVVQDAGPLDEEFLGLLDRDVQHREVGGQDAVLSRTTQKTFDGRAIAWIQGGHLVRVVTTGFDAEAGIAVAESLRAVGEAEYRRRGEQVEPPDGAQPIADGGEGADRWSVYLEDDRSLCVDRADGASCGGPTDLGTITVDTDGDPTLVVATAPSGAAVDVLDGTRSLLVGEPVELDDGLLYFAAVVPEGVESVELTIDDGLGDGVDRRTVRTDEGAISTGGVAPTTTAG